MSSNSPYLTNLNEEQRAAVVHGKPPLLILAGAGSGKTRVVTTRIAYLIDQLSFSPDQILAVTFTNKAAREMQERVNLLLADRAPDSPSGHVLIKTFHSFCSWFLRRNAASAGLDPYFGIYDDEDSLSLVKTVLPEHLSPHEARNFLHAISRAKDDDLSPDDELGSISFHPEFPEVYRLYEEKLSASGNVDFGGLILKTVRLLRKNTEIRSRIRQKFLAILVDEYQDCNGAQSALLEQLYGPATWLTVVGDDDQSIYGFRGADVRHILDFSNRFPGTSVIRLEQNYRSTGHILAIASQVVQHNRSRLGKT
ncbi:MAG: UvrD-helicase domain-containing protein, partial [Spirochaetales bacterium]|nr:UvrD-helicase domain-containing protein [Spirochaetales bacterium]